MEKEKATFEQYLQIGQMIKSRAIDKDLAQAIIRGCVRVVDNPLGTIAVPDLSGPELIAEAKKTLDLTHFDEGYAMYDFLRDERGKKYEVMIWKPGRDLVSTEEVRAYFEERGFRGSPTAFIAWVTKYNPDGNHATIPEDDGPFPRAVGYLYAPNYICVDDYRKLGLCFYNGVRANRRSCWAYVAFREIHS